MELIQGSTDDKRSNLEIWNDQKMLADDYCLFVETAIKRGFKIEIALIVDGQVCRSSTYLNTAYMGGHPLLREFLRVAAWERQIIEAKIARLMTLPENKPGQESP
jgi:hypothetical protein